MHLRKQKVQAHQVRAGYADDAPLCMCGQWFCPDVLVQLDHAPPRVERILNVGQVIVLWLAFTTLVACCVGGFLWLG